MKIWTLMENTTVRKELAAEHGLSLYIEANGKRILFDAGQSGAYWDNAAKMGIDLTRVDFMVLSHGHYDHGGGLKRFLEENHHAPVYVSSRACGDYYNAADRYIGLAPELKNHSRLIAVTKDLELAEGITLLSCHDRKMVVPLDSAGLQKKDGEVLQPDDFAHEQYLLVEEKGKKVLFSGCSHRGIENIVQWIPCDVLIGGFHFMKKEPHGQEIRDAAAKLLQEKTRYFTCHCTGLEQYAVMKEIMGNRLQYLATGDAAELEEGEV